MTFILPLASFGRAWFVRKRRGRFTTGRQVSIGNSPSTVGESSSQVLDGREREPREDGDLYNPRQVQIDRAGLLRDRLPRDVEGQKSGRQANSNVCQLSLNQLFNGDEAQKNYQEKMPPEKEVCLQLAQGLAHIHEKGFIYWDIKPQNVFIFVHPTDVGNVSMKWADFVLSSPLNDRGSFSTTEQTHGPIIGWPLKCCR